MPALYRGKAQAMAQAIFNTGYPVAEQAVVNLPEVVRCIAPVQRFECAHQCRSASDQTSAEAAIQLPLCALHFDDVTSTTLGR
jgi:hypothetical protein